MTALETRHERLLAAQRVGARGVAKLAAVRAAVLGVGAVGGRVAELLASVFGSVLLVDRGRVEAENLGAQGFQEIDLDVPKVEARAHSLHPINRACRIETLHADLRDVGLAALGPVDLLFVAFDSRAARITASEFARRNRYFMIDCAVDGSGRSLIGRVAAYAPDGACYVCPRDASELGRILHEGSAGCAPWTWGRVEESGEPTRSLPSVAAAVAAIAVTWGVRLLLDGPADVVGREMLIDLDRDTTSVHRLPRNPRCLAEHRAFDPVPVPRHTVWQTLRDAARLVGEPASLELQRRGVACAIRCPECLQERRPYKLLDAITPTEGWCACGSVLIPAADAILSSFGAEQAAPFLSRTWDELGLPPADVVVARGPKGVVDLCLM